MVVYNGIRTDLGTYWLCDIVSLALKFPSINLLNGDDNNCGGN